MSPDARKARYVMVGGFLGAGKTTAILRLAEHLAAGGRRVGLITNDQSVGLVDTALLGSHGFPVEEITGGCFCCRFNSLVDAADRLSRDEAPDVFIAEPVGSCTDLKASVSYPLRRLYGDAFSIAPLGVLVDPVRALRVLGVEDGRSFSRKVLYVYAKQLEEAELLVINKIDLLSPDRLAALRRALADRLPATPVVEMSAREGTGLAAWFDRLAAADLGSGCSMDLDYDTYGEGEALLGWLNCTLRAGGAPFDGNALLLRLARRLGARLREGEAEVAHLKMTLSPDEAAGDIGVLNLARGDAEPEASHALQAPLAAGELVLNLRAEADPELLRRAVMEAIEAESAGGVSLWVEHLEHFRPAKPQPTYRDAS